MVEHDDLGGEVRNTGGGLVLGVGGDVATLDVLHGHVLDVEADVVAGDGLRQRLVVHLDGLDLGGEGDGGEGDDHAGLDHSSLNTTDGHCANASNFVDILNNLNIISIRSQNYVLEHDYAQNQSQQGL